MDPLTPTEDIRAARHRLAAKFDNDLDRIVADLRRQESESSAEFVSRPRRPPTHDELSIAPESPTTRFSGGESNSATG